MTYVIVSGNPMDGLLLTGPFSDGDTASSHAEDYFHGEEWWVVRVEEPVEE